MSSGGIPIGDLLRLDRQQGRLICAGTPVDLKRKAFDVLCVLADAEGAIVSKDELLSRVWPDDAVEDNNLHVHVSALRKALHRHAAGTVDLVTVPGKDYELLVRLVCARPAASRSSGGIATNATSTTSSRCRTRSPGTW